MKTEYTTILFDLDDTLLDFATAELKTLNYIHKEYYSSFEFDYFSRTYQDINNKLWERVGSGRNSILPADVRYQRFLDLHARLEIDLSFEMVAHSFESFLGRNTGWIDGVESVIELLADKGYKLGIITNGLTSVQYLKYETNLLHQWFDCFIVSDEVGIAKPGQGIFELAFRKMNINRENLHQVLYVGDSLISDGYGAQNAGVDFAFINRKKIDVANHDAKVKFNLNSVAELPKLFSVNL